MRLKIRGTANSKVGLTSPEVVHQRKHALGDAHRCATTEKDVQLHRLTERVRPRQKAQAAVVLIHRKETMNRVDVGDDVAVREDRAFGFPSLPTYRIDPAVSSSVGSIGGTAEAAPFSSAQRTNTPHFQELQS